MRRSRRPETRTRIWFKVGIENLVKEGNGGGAGNIHRFQVCLHVDDFQGYRLRNSAGFRVRRGQDPRWVPVRYHQVWRAREGVA